MLTGQSSHTRLYHNEKRVRCTTDKWQRQVCLQNKKKIVFLEVGHIEQFVACALSYCTSSFSHLTVIVSHSKLVISVRTN